jgi:hypothetical protein
MKLKILLGVVIATSWIAMLCGVSQMIWGVGGSWYVGDSGVRVFQGFCLICLLSVAWPMAAWEERYKQQVKLAQKE